MAQRTISTRLAIEGESEYRASITRINAEIRNAQSALKLVESEYQNNAGSMAALSAKGEALSGVFAAQKEKVLEMERGLKNAQSAEEEYARKKAEITAKIEENRKALEELKASTENTSQEQKKLTSENEKLNQQLQENEGYLAAAHKGVTKWETDLNSAKTALNNTGAALEANRKSQQALTDATETGTKAAKEHKGALADQNAALDNLASVLAASGIQQSLKEIADVLHSCVNASVEFESAMAGVAKTTDLSDNELASMGEKFKELSAEMPISASELAGIAEAAGQLGIAKENIADFSVVMANLGVATNLTSEEAATLLARFANVTGMDPSLYENLGSVIVALGNTMATTENEIVNMGQRLSAAGELAGLTEPEIMALSAAMSSVGIEAEAGGTAMTQTLSAMETAVAKGSEKLNGFARVAGMSAEEFSTAWKTSPITAIQAFISGLGKLDEQGESAVLVLDELDLKGIRQGNMLKSLGLASDVLANSINTANNAWTQNTALAKEAATRYETTESKFTMLKNSVTNLKIAVGDQLTPALGNLAESGTDIISWASEFIQNNEWLVPTVSALASAIGVLAGAVVGFTVVTKAVIPLVKAFNTALSDNPIGIVVTALAAVTAAVTTFATFMKDDAVTSVEEMTEAAREMDGVIADANATYENTVSKTEAAANVAKGYISRLQDLEATGLKTNEQQDEYHNILCLLCETIPELSQYIDLENDKIQGGTEVLLANTEAWKENAKAQALQEKLAEIQSKQVEAEIEYEQASIRATGAKLKKAAVEERMNQALERQDELSRQAMEAAEKDIELTGQSRDRAAYLSDEYAVLEEQIDSYRKQLETADEEIANATEAQETCAAAISDAKKETELAEKAVSNLTGELENNSAAAGENAQTSTDAADGYSKMQEAAAIVEKGLKDLNEAWAKEYEAAYNSINSQVGLFDDFAVKAEEDTYTVTEMMDRWATQTENLNNYTRNLKLAAQYGIDDGLLKSLSDGSAESAGYLQTIITEYQNLGAGAETTKEQIENSTGPLKDFHDQFNDTFRDTGEARAGFSSTVADIQTDYDNMLQHLTEAAGKLDASVISDSLRQAFKDVGVEEIGQNFAEGLSGGISSKAGDVALEAAGIADDALTVLREKWKIKSPSKETEAIGEYFGEGLITGIEEKAPQVVVAVEQMGAQAKTALKQSAAQAVNAFTAEYSKLADAAKEKMDQLRIAVREAASPLLGDMRTVGEQMVDGMINGINGRSNSLYGSIASVVNEAISAAKKAAATASPSKKTTKIFEDVGDGMIVGLEHKKEKVVSTAQSVVDEALRLDTSDQIRRAIETINDRPPALLEYQQQTNASPVTYQIGDIHVDIIAQDADSEALYRTMKKRLEQEARHKIQATRGGRQ